MTEIDTGISAEDRALVGEELKKLLAEAMLDKEALQVALGRKY